MRWPVMLSLFLPFVIFVAVVAIIYSHMENVPAENSNIVPNALENVKRPNIILPALLDKRQFNINDFDGQVSLVNFWGSWCPPCHQEHPILMEIAKDKRFNLLGINYKDDRENALRFLNNLGNPYHATANISVANIPAIGFDKNGRAAIDFGVYGPPETFIINKAGKIIYKHIGPLDFDIYKNTLLPKIEKALIE